MTVLSSTVNDQPAEFTTSILTGATLDVILTTPEGETLSDVADQKPSEAPPKNITIADLFRKD